MQVAIQEAAQAHARLGLIIARADECLGHLEERERIVRRIRAAQRRRARPSPSTTRAEGVFAPRSEPCA